MSEKPVTAWGAMLAFEETVDFGTHISSRMMGGATLEEIAAEFSGALLQCFPDYRLLIEAEYEPDMVCEGCGISMTDHEDFEPDGSDCDDPACEHGGTPVLRRVYLERKVQAKVQAGRAKRKVKK